MNEYIGGIYLLKDYDKIFDTIKEEEAFDEILESFSINEIFFAIICSSLKIIPSVSKKKHLSVVRTFFEFCRDLRPGDADWLWKNIELALSAIL
jgi:hypothetical protein